VAEVTGADAEAEAEGAAEAEAKAEAEPLGADPPTLVTEAGAPPAFTFSVGTVVVQAATNITDENTIFFMTIYYPLLK
jgi:hypothetical protein